MTGADFAYYRPDTLEEALAARARLGDSAFYYGGGTEILTGARSGLYAPRAVIDIKSLSECRERGARGGTLFFGSGLALSDLVEDPTFPLLAAAARGVADRTVRNRISLGGNCAGRLPWREALLPFLALDGTVHLAAPGVGGRPVLREVPLSAVHGKRLALAPGELVLGFSVAAGDAALPWHHERITRGPSVDYPIASLCMARRGDTLMAAVSGAFDFPFRALVQGRSFSLPDFPATRTDLRASSAYRSAMLALALAKAEEALS
jgi:CO/xanthine dehydrogenase FAD-binding subunit